MSTTTTDTKVSVIRSKGDRWCQLDVSLTKDRLSISGSQGRILTTKNAKREALEYWESFFDEDRSQLHEMNDRLGRNFRTAKAAARFVVESDGDYHGLDVHAERGNSVYLTESCGQIREDLATWFPEVKPFLKWHLNDMHAECIHQEARGETWATHPDTECPDCGYHLGSAWTKRALPPEVIAWVEGLKTTAEVIK